MWLSTTCATRSLLAVCVLLSNLVNCFVSAKTCQDQLGNNACEWKFLSKECYTCGQRIDWLQTPAGGTTSESIAKGIVSKEFPSACGACATSLTPESNTKPSTTSSTTTSPHSRAHGLSNLRDSWLEYCETLPDKPWFWGVIAGLCIYLILMFMGCCGFGPPWFRDLFYCWPDVCMGGGCILYKILCCPLVVPFNSLRIYVGTCCQTYLMTICKCDFCKGCCWTPYEDPEFPPSKWQTGTKGDVASGGQGAGLCSYKRAPEIGETLEAGAQLFEGKIEPADLLQGAIGNCWLIAGLACVAERPEILQCAFITRRITPHGKYRFRLWNTVKGKPGAEWVTIIIDDMIPVNQRGQPMFAESNNNEMWAMLLEKAFAKMYGGYDELEGGQMWWPISAITGNDPITIRKYGGSWRASPGSGPGDPQSMDEDELFRLLNKLDRNGAFLSCAGVASGQAPQGLIDGHAYSILRVASVGKSALSTEFFRMVQCRNPWGRNEWKGNWSDKSGLWEKFPYVKSKLEAEDKEDGTFWMQWEDFCAMWKEVQIVDCNTDIHTVGTPIYDERSSCGPVWACLKGCFDYWCCCIGFFRLYCGRSKAANLEEMQQDLDRECGIDQSGIYCKGLRRKAARENYSLVQQSDSGSESEDLSQQS